MILDEIHLLGADRGPILEVIVWVFVKYCSQLHVCFHFSDSLFQCYFSGLLFFVQ